MSSAGDCSPRGGISSVRVGDPAAPWLVVRQHAGPQAVQAAYREVLDGRGDPRFGHMLSLAEPAPG
jgi:hypothetical protein